MKTLYESILSPTSKKVEDISNMKCFGSVYKLEKVMGMDDVPFYGLSRNLGKDMADVESINDLDSVMDEFNRVSYEFIGNARELTIRGLLKYIDNYYIDTRTDLNKQSNKDEFLKQLFDELQSKGYVRSLKIDNENSLTNEKDPKDILYIYLHYKVYTFVIVYKKR